MRGTQGHRALVRSSSCPQHPTDTGGYDSRSTHWPPGPRRATGGTDPRDASQEGIMQRRLLVGLAAAATLLLSSVPLVSAFTPVHDSYEAEFDNVLTRACASSTSPSTPISRAASRRPSMPTATRPCGSSAPSSRTPSVPTGTPWSDCPSGSLPNSLGPRRDLDLLLRAGRGREGAAARRQHLLERGPLQLAPGDRAGRDLYPHSRQRAFGQRRRLLRSTNLT